MYGLELTLILRTLHILGGIFWVGAGLMSVFFIGPAVRAVGSDGVKVMHQLMGPRKLPLALNVAAIVAIVSGFFLYSRNISLSAGVWASSTAGMVFGVGAVAAVIALILGNLFIGPAGKKLSVVAKRLQSAGGPPSPADLELIERLGGRMRRFTQINLVLLLLVTVTMAIGRYM